MTNSYQLPGELETVDVGYWVCKFGLGPFLIYIAMTSFHLGHLALSILFCVPLTFAGVFFFMALTRVKPESGALAVRRFFSWHELAYREIQDCDDSLFLLFIGSIRIKRYVPPFGKIYFWIPVRARSNRIDRALILYIRQRAGLAE
jgi:hypothetical protein